MPPALLILSALVAAIAVVALYSRRQRQRLVERLHDDWGTANLLHPFDRHLSSEAWKELDGSTGETGIDDQTWFDLHLDEVLGSIDRTHTGLGVQMLYRRLRNGTAWNVEAFEGLTERFGEHQPTRGAVGIILASAGRSLGKGLWIISRPGLIYARWWYWCFPILGLAMIVCLIAIPFSPRFFLVAFAVVMINMVVRIITGWQIPELLAPMRQMKRLIKTAESLAAMPDLSEVLPTGFAEDVERLRPLRRVASWMSRNPNTQEEASFQEWLNLLFLLDANALLFGSRHLRRLGPVVSRVACWVGDVDVALSIASLRAQPRPWCIPEWDRTGNVRIEGVWHPLLSSPVPNGAELLAGSGMIITGANASGKTTYIRAVGVAAILARTLNACPAAFYKGSHFRVRSLIAGNDDLLTGRSYYQVEVDGVVGLLNAARAEAPTLFLLDELLLGTNTVDRLAAGEVILRALLEDYGHGPRHFVIVATHDGELTLRLDDLYQPWHFRESVTAEGISFDYRRRSGPATTRTALALLEAAGAPKAVVDAARIRAEAMERPVYGPPV